MPTIRSNTSDSPRKLGPIMNSVLDEPCPVSAVTRRHFLWRAGSGLSGIALAWLLNREQTAGAAQPAPAINNKFPAPPLRPQFRPRAKRVVHIYACGGVSHVDTFDH